MIVVYHPDIIEGTVLLAARHDAARECELHQETDRLYAISEAETRDDAFQKAHARFFDSWQLGRAVESQISESALPEKVDRCLLVPALGAKRQHVDLLSKGGREGVEHTIMIQLRPESLLDPAPLADWLRRELLQVSDMLDDAFGYQPDAIGGTAWERRLQQDRYMVVWRMYAAARLLRAGLVDQAELSALRSTFDKAFMQGGKKPVPQVFDRLMNIKTLTHTELLSWAQSPQKLPGCGQADRPGPNPGGLCPLCGFPTYDWYDFQSQPSGSWIDRLKVTHPSWHENVGACRQCIESYVYRVRAPVASACKLSIGGKDVSKEEWQECGIS